jgi:hypothetical protein
MIRGRPPSSSSAVVVVVVVETIFTTRNRPKVTPPLQIKFGHLDTTSWDLSEMRADVDAVHAAADDDDDDIVVPVVAGVVGVDARASHRPWTVVRSFLSRCPCVWFRPDGGEADSASVAVARAAAGGGCPPRPASRKGPDRSTEEATPVPRSREARQRNDCSDRRRNGRGRCGRSPAGPVAPVIVVPPVAAVASRSRVAPRRAAAAITGRPDDRMAGRRRPDGLCAVPPRWGAAPVDDTD